MSSKSIVDQIRHYQRDIERCPENSERMIRCIQRLYVLPILVQHLQETGVGRSVNSLRKFNGEVGEAAKALVTKWKAMVAAEESDDGDCAPKETDAKQNPPNAHSNENNSKTPKDSNSSSKHDSSRHSSSHKRSHSSTTSESKADRKSSSSSTDKTDRKSSSEKNDKHRYSQHESKSKETVHVKEEKGSKSHVSSKDGDRSTSSSHRSKSERRDKDEDSDRSPCRKKRKKNCVKERRKEAQESDDGSSGREDAAQDRESESDRVLPDLPDEDSDDDRGDHGGNNISRDSDDDEDEGSEKGSSSEEDSDPKSRKKLSSSEHHKSNSSSHGSSSSSKHKHSHQKEEKSDSKKSSSSSSKSSSKDLQKMIKENEKKIKREKFEKTNYDSGGSTPKGSSSPTKNKEKSVKVKVETNDDGSIDAGSGFSFADALAGLNPAPKKKKKANKDDVLSPKPSSSISSSSSSHHKSSSSSSHSQKKSSSSSSLPSNKKEKHSDTAMPELLKRPIKLENLELDINSTLPEINPNYRPLPHVPEPLRRNSTKSATNEEEMFNMMMNKNQRTKVFSGGKSNLNTQVPTLYDLCIKLLYDNIDGLEYTGGVPYDLLKPLLEKLNPDQLFVLEHYNAYLIEDTGTLWEFHAKKDFRNKGRQEGETWRDLYIRCMEEREEKLKALTQNITQSIAASTPVRKAKLAYVDSAVKPPRNIARQQAKYGTGAGDASPIMKAHAAEKREIIAKAVVGAHNPANIATTTVPAPPQSSAPRSWSTPAPINQKKRKAPLMAKALQLIKGTNRFKR